MELKFSDRGLATAYLTLPLQKFDAERHVVQRAYTEWIETTRHRPPAVSQPEFVYLLGQADMAIHFEITSDFRRLFDIRYPYPASVSLTVNWLYSVPYVLESLAPPGENSFRFVIHLRLHREVYAYPAIESSIVRHLHEVLASNDVAAEIHAALGWSDLLIRGHFESAKFAGFVNALTAIHDAHIIAAGEPFPISTRMLTLIGYSLTGTPSTAHERHVTLVRGTPGYLRQLKEPLADLGHAYLMAGKTDFLILTEGELSPNALELQRHFAEDDPRAEQIQKLETHLVLNRVSDLNLAPVPIETFDERKHFRRCLCSMEDAEMRSEIDAYLHLLPYELRQAVQNTLLLLAGMMTDPSICCDVRHAMFACESALLSLLHRLADVSERAVPAASEPLSAPDFEAGTSRREQRFAARRRQQQEVYRVYRAATDWHVYTERVLRQRSVGSFEEMLGQTDRAITYNGGVQKFLFLADSLIADFVQRIDRLPARRLPRFATLYDSLKTILSFRDAATIRIPVRKIFQLPLVVADLWHEVGVYLFFLRFNFEDSNDAASPAAAQAHFSNLADLYGDLIVYLYGFHGDWDRAMNSLISGWIDVFADEIHAEVRGMALFDVAWRAYVLTEFDALYHQQGFVGSNRDQLVDATLQRVANFLNAPRYDRWREHLRMTIGEWQRIKRMSVGPEIEQIHDLYVDLLIVPKRPPTPAHDFSQGIVRTLSATDDLNDVFAHVADWLLNKRPVPNVAFRAMAALGKSVVIEYHRRQMSGDKWRARSRVRIR